MGVSYNRLWKMLIDKNMKRIEMQYLTGISGNILARMGKTSMYQWRRLRRSARSWTAPLMRCLQKSKKKLKKITRRIRHKSLSNAKSALLYRQFHLPVSCDLRCCSRFQEISNREIQRNQRFRTRGRSPCGTDAYP